VNERLLLAAKHVNWYTEPEVLVADSERFLCEIMARGTIPDVLAAKEVFDFDQFQRAYDNAPPGLFDKRSWAYWGLILYSDPCYLPIPERFEDGADFDWRS
jgi:hypothetical protein